MRLFLFIVCGFLLTNLTYAQSNITGRIFENQTKAALQGIRVENLKSHDFTMSDPSGRFAMQANKGDLLCFTGFNYQPDTLLVTNAKYIEVYLILKQNMLKEVTVKNQQIKTGSFKPAPTMSPINNQAVTYSQDEKGNYKGGVTFNVPTWGKKDQRKQEQQLEEHEKTSSQITEAFSEKNLKNYIPITGQELNNFRILYTPDIKTYTSSEFNMSLYIDSCYKEFSKYPAEQRQSPTYFQLTPQH